MLAGSPGRDGSAVLLPVVEWRGPGLHQALQEQGGPLVPPHHLLTHQDRRGDWGEEEEEEVVVEDEEQWTHSRRELGSPVSHC